MITPLFGGGYEAGVVDPEMPIRPSSIRGHLRFWWRAVRGGSFSDHTALLKRESEIWGSTEMPSRVSVNVKNNGNQVNAIPCAQYVHNPNRNRGAGGFDLIWDDSLGNSLPYVLFPFQGIAPDKPHPIDPSVMIRPFHFTLSLKFPNEMTDEIESAIWAWVNFGGIGARTRRGCGALYCEELAPQNATGIGIWYSENLNKYRKNLMVSSAIPTLPDKLLIKDNGHSNPLQRWSEVISVMKDFRQGRDIGRNPGRGGPRLGRSYWPEPESIRKSIMAQRRATNRDRSWHGQCQNVPLPLISFPRAEFGMPIIFEIRGEGIKPTLTPAQNLERMASPLILRPYKCQDGSSVQLIVKLQTPTITSAYLKPPSRPDRRDLQNAILVSPIATPNNAKYPHSPMGPPGRASDPRSANGSALEAFIAYAIEKGYKEVS